MNKTLSIAFIRALYAVAQDAEVQAVWQKGTVHFQTMINLFGYENRREDYLAAELRDFILKEARAAEAAERDLSRQHFTMADCALLQLNDKGRALLDRLAAGDTTSVEEATTFLREMRRIRKDLGLDY